MLTIENNQKIVANHKPKLGEFYARGDDPSQVYLVTRHYSHVTSMYGLINLATGCMYTDPDDNIYNIFGNFSDKFYLITKDIKITIG
jgi:hypothetical protein